jgi:hypothetical protein
MGRNKILIKAILSKRKRRNTYNKRWPGLKKKAHELSVLCNQDVFLYARDQDTGVVKMYSSSAENFAPDYESIKPKDRDGPNDMSTYYQLKAKEKKAATLPERRVNLNAIHPLIRQLLENTYRGQSALNNFSRAVATT